MLVSAPLPLHDLGRVYGAVEWDPDHPLARHAGPTRAAVHALLLPPSAPLQTNFSLMALRCPPSIILVSASFSDAQEGREWG